jgi:hypothetical protein
MAMYDTIHLWLPADLAGAIDIDRVSEPLKGLTEHQKEDGRVYISGGLGNTYKVNISEQGVSLKGSLAKYFLPDNLHTLTRSDSTRAIEKMADELCLPVELAKVTRIDFAQNFLMRYEPEAYYPFLGECQYFKRLSQPKAVYWSNGNRTKLVYNKVAEAKAKGTALPDVWSGQNVLRYEMRYTRRLSKNLKQPEIIAKTLHDEKFYMALVNRWIQEYEAIHKLNTINLNITDMNSPKDFFKQMALMQIRQIGQTKAMDLVEDMRAKRAFTKPEYYSRLKKEIRDLCKTPEITASSDLITELNKKVNAAKRYCR